MGTFWRWSIRLRVSHNHWDQPGLQPAKNWGKTEKHREKRGANDIAKEQRKGFWFNKKGRPWKRIRRKGEGRDKGKEKTRKCKANGIKKILKNGAVGTVHEGKTTRHGIWYLKKKQQPTGPTGPPIPRNTARGAWPSAPWCGHERGRGGDGRL